MRIAQERQTQMNINILTRPRTAADFTFELPVVKNGSQSLAGAIYICDGSPN